MHFPLQKDLKNEVIIPIHALKTIKIIVETTFCITIVEPT